MKEYELIKLIKGIIDSDLNLIGDDTAVIKDKGLVLTTDTLIQDTHFRLDTTSAYDLGYKVAAVNLSDIAASGGKCQYVLVSLSLPKDFNTSFVEDLYRGIKYILDQFDSHVVGGDLTYCDKVIINITAIGYTNVSTGRNFARTGDKIITTGSYGASYTGLQLLEANRKNCIKDNIDINLYQSVLNKHLKPWPRINEAQFFVKKINYDSYCMMDTSDGLADALLQISSRSNKRLNLYLDKIPVDSKVAELVNLMNLNLYDTLLYGGEDFELLLTCNNNDANFLTTNKDYQFTEIGEVIEATPGVSLLYNAEKIELDEKLLEDKISFKHF